MARVRIISDNPFELNKALNSNPFNTLQVLMLDKNIKKDNILANAIRQMIENFKRFIRYNAYSMMKGVIPFANSKGGEGVECGYYDYAKTADYQVKMAQLKTLLGINPLYDHPYIQQKYETLKSFYPEASFRQENGEFHIVEKYQYTKEEMKVRKKQGLPKEKFRFDVKARLFVMNEEEYREFRKSLMDMSRAVIGEDGAISGAKDSFRPEMLVKELNGQFVVNNNCPEVRAFVGKTLLARNIQNMPVPEVDKEKELQESVKEPAPDKPQEVEQPIAEEKAEEVAVDKTAENEAPKPPKVKEVDFDEVIKKLGDGRIIETPVFICDTKNPNNYIEVSSTKEAYEDGRPYVNTEYKVFKDGVQQECDEFSHKKFTHYTNFDGENTSSHGIKHWEKILAEMREKGGFSDKVIAFKDKERYDSYLKQLNEYLEHQKAQQEVVNEEVQLEPQPQESPADIMKTMKNELYRYTKEDGGKLVQYHFTDKEKANMFEESLLTNGVMFMRLGSLSDKIDFAVRDLDKKQVDILMGIEKEVEPEPTPTINEKPDIAPICEPFSEEQMKSQPELEVFQVDEVIGAEDVSCTRVLVNGLECNLYDAGDEKSFEVFEVAKYRGDNKHVIIPSKVEFDGAVYTLEGICAGAFDATGVETIQINASGLDDILSDKEAITQAFCLGYDTHNRPKFPIIYWTGLSETQYAVFKQERAFAEKFLAAYEQESLPARKIDMAPSVKEKEVVQEQEHVPDRSVVQQSTSKAATLNPLMKSTKQKKGMDL